MPSNSASDHASAQALAVELRVLLSRLRRRLREEASAGDLSESQRSVLLRLERHEPSSVTELAVALGVRSQSMGATVAALVEAGFVKGEPDPADGRRTILSLTPAARKTFKAVRTAREDWLLHAIEANYTPAEQRQLATGVALLQRLVEP
jgi:DNA-binding MarR family transcriptional regulator